MKRTALRNPSQTRVITNKNVVSFQVMEELLKKMASESDFPLIFEMAQITDGGLFNKDSDEECLIVRIDPSNERRLKGHEKQLFSYCIRMIQLGKFVTIKIQSFGNGFNYHSDAMEQEHFTLEIEVERMYYNVINAMFVDMLDLITNAK